MDEALSPLNFPQTSPAEIKYLIGQAEENKIPWSSAIYRHVQTEVLNQTFKMLPNSLLEKRIEGGTQSLKDYLIEQSGFANDDIETVLGRLLKSSTAFTSEEITSLQRFRTQLIKNIQKATDQNSVHHLRILVSNGFAETCAINGTESPLSDALKRLRGETYATSNRGNSGLAGTRSVYDNYPYGVTDCESIGSFKLKLGLDKVILNLTEGLVVFDTQTGHYTILVGR